ANRGGCHVTGYTISTEILGIPEKIDPLTLEGKAKWVKFFQDFTCVVNSTVNCLFVTFALGVKDYVELLSAVTGWSLSENDLLRIGERIHNLERVLINKLGFDGKDDTLPKRLLEEPMPEGPAKGHVAKLERMKEEYYKIRGWVNGVPTIEKLKELEIEL
ncbi:MAG: aldehyde ferredoxin oxidoreductase C-terminal domain-containing protein, partial [Thermoproteota archaeon]